MSDELSIPMRGNYLRLEGADPDVVPPYMTQPEGPRWHKRGVKGAEVEVVDERGVLWIRSRHPGGAWSLWARMEEGPTED